MKFGRKKTDRGFTLVELLVYIAIVSIVLVIAIGFVWDIIHGYTKAGAFREVQQNGRLAMDLISAEIRGAISINSPTIGSSGLTLSLATYSSSTNPTVIDVSGNRLRIARGASGPYFLTSSDVVVANLFFSNLSYANTSGTMRVEMDIARVNSNNRLEYAASSSFKSSVSLRR